VPNKELIIAAGPNGSGKSTFISGLLAERPRPYLSADLIATEFPDLDALSRQLAAGREFILRAEQQLARHEDFIIETTMSGRTLQHFVRRAKLVGFEVTIVFIYVDSPETSLARVRERVRRGGHDVSEDDIRRRFRRCFTNFWGIYREIADYWYVYYNYGGEFRRIASGEQDAILVRDDSAFRQFLALAGETPDAEADD
jgi:predicted ABC-type ATPase